jgi:prephenate dehydrogenase
VIKIDYWLRSSGLTEKTDMSKPRITIIGLGLVGGSIGLGLRSGTKAVQVVGHDREPGIGKLAQKKGAVDKSTMNLLNACEDADLVVIATPISAIRETLELIGPHLKQGCVVTDTATVKEPVLAWAAETLPAGVSFVGGDPLLRPNAGPEDLAALRGIESADADLFQNALYVLCPSSETSPRAIKRVTDMISLLKARAFYGDPVEHDGMRAAVEGLPQLTSLAMMRQASGSPGWKEARKLADHVFGAATASLTDDAATQSAQALLNADHLLPRIDVLIHELTRIREWIATGNADALQAAFDQAASARSQWLMDRAKGDWEEELVELGVKGTLGSLTDMVGFGLAERKPKEK